MATAQAIEVLSTCSICYGDFINPRKLPGCYHTFCENCVLTYITNIESNDKGSCEFHCPNCRRKIPIPESAEDLQNWVKSLEILIKEENMASNTGSDESASNELCVSCKDEGASVLAEKYCVDCGEGVCAKCSRIRHRPKLFRDHAIIDLEASTKTNYDNDSTLHALSEYLRCSDHPNKCVSFVCMDDNILCCTECVIENHRYCDTVEKIESLSSKSENESTITKTKGRVEDTVSQIKDLIDFKKQNGSDNVTEVKKKAEMLTDTVKEIRTKINTLFDVLEERIASKAKAISKKCGMEVEEDSSKLKDISKTLTEHITVIDHAVTVASDNQTYVILRNLAIKIEEAAMSFSEACQNCCRHGMDLKIQPILQNLCELGTNDTDQLAEVTEEFEKTPLPGVAESLLCFHRKVEKVAEHDILPENAPYSYPEYYGMIYTRDPRATRRMFLVSTYGRFCCSVDNNYKATECFENGFLTGNPYGLTELKHNVIAVGLPEEKKIVLLSENEESNNLEIVGHVKTKFQPKAICGLRNGNIALSYDKPVGFGILSFKWCLYTCRFKEKIYFVKDGAGRPLKTFDFMAVDENRSHVIQPCTKDKAVYCFDFEGNPKFKYRHQDLVLPRGVSISSDGNIFVCDQQKSVIHVISPGGQELHVVREGCPERPLAIAFDPRGSQFAVSQNQKPWIKVRIFRMT